MAIRQAHAEWKGALKEGSGEMALGSGSYKGPFSFVSRFDTGSGTNPEELIGAAHAGCFSMALSAQLGEAGMTADRIATTASVSLEKVEGGFAITAIHLTVKATIPGADAAKFQTAANNAKAGCPVSKVLNATITMDAALEA